MIADILVEDASGVSYDTPFSYGKINMIRKVLIANRGLHLEYRSCKLNNIKTVAVYAKWMQTCYMLDLLMKRSVLVIINQINPI